MNRDEVTMVLYRNIDIDALVTAKRNGSLLSYLNGIAERILGPTPQARETVSDPNVVRPPTPPPMGRNDRVRVANL